MEFIRWLVLERFLPSSKPENVFMSFFLSFFFGGFLTAVLWPWFLPFSFLIISFWGVVIFVIVSQWLKEMKEEWRQDTGGDK